MIRKKITCNQQGFAALLTVIIVSASALVMSLGTALLGIGELELGYTAQKGGAARAITEGCLEEALHHLRIDVEYAGSTYLTEHSACTITISGSGNDRIITVDGSLEDTYYSHLTVTVSLVGSIYPTLTITDWTEH